MKYIIRIGLFLIISLGLCFIAHEFTAIKSVSFHDDVLSNSNFRKYIITAHTNNGTIKNDTKWDDYLSLNEMNDYADTNFDNDFPLDSEQKRTTLGLSHLFRESHFGREKRPSNTESEILRLFDELPNYTEENKQIVNCITGKTYGFYKSEYDTHLYAENKTKETVNDRKKSFEDVFKTRAWGHDWDISHKGLNASGKFI